MIDVLIVEDSPSMSMILERILAAATGLRVVGTVDSGEAALFFLKNQDSSRLPHVITMDIVMPGMDGFTTCRRIMESTPVPIIIVSSAYHPHEAESSFKAMEAGAVAIIEKPVALNHPDYERVAKNMVETVRLMSEVRVVTRWRRDKETAVGAPRITPAPSVPRQFDLIAFGASTGGPPVLKTILEQLPKDLPIPILIVQHISRGFIDSMGTWLQSTTGFPVRIPKNGEIWKPGHVYLAPDGVQMGVKAGNRIVLTAGKPESRHCPSVSCLFHSVALGYSSRAIGVLLTGMGDDGAAELRMMKEMKAVTIAQDEKSCVVYGMPGEAVKIGAAEYILPPEAIAARIRKLAEGNNRD